ncbi:hypothetical protein CDAR_88421 [Caerostris darwini]|uniref:Uncharacterized protein n=1 Tax=Caerostris darwini TaxID=1538125 RepID=A0AAV4Q4J3_9ARAC|nr:hypothetical protein CDAR_88421 [Caerostris darwini]
MKFIPIQLSSKLGDKLSTQSPNQRYSFNKRKKEPPPPPLRTLFAKRSEWELQTFIKCPDFPALEVMFAHNSERAYLAASDSVLRTFSQINGI